MKRIILIALLLFVGRESAWAGACEENLGNAFTPNQRVVLCTKFGDSISNSLIPSADNAYDLGSASFSWRDLFVDRNALIGGTLGVTGVTTLTGSVNFASSLVQDATTGSSLIIQKNATGIQGVGAIAVNLRPGAGGTIALTNSSNTRIFYTDGADFYSDATNGGNFILAKTGKTIAVDSGTGASTCAGTLTANGATPVVTSTTCALTASRIFLSKQSASTAVNGSCTVTAISNGVSFTVACLATDTGTYNFWITQEG